MKTIINVKWGIPAEQPTIEELPTEFSEAQTLWSQDKACGTSQTPSK